MSILREIAGAVVGVYALLFVCDALFGVNERFDDAYYRSSTYAPSANEFRFASSTTPAERVSDAFAQFTPRQAKPDKRYSSLTTVVR
jgi:hypothetical protein